MVDFLTFMSVLFCRGIFAPLFVYALCEIVEHYNICFNVASCKQKGQHEMVDCLKGVVKKFSSRVWSSFMLTQCDLGTFP